MNIIVQQFVKVVCQCRSFLKYEGMAIDVFFFFFFFFILFY